MRWGVAALVAALVWATRDVTAIEQAKIDAFVQWLQKQGTTGLDKVEVKASEGSGLGLFARRDVQEGEVEYDVPIGAVMNMNAALQSTNIGPIIANVYHTGVFKSEAAFGFHACVLFLQYEAFYNTTSRFSPYLQTLPLEFPTKPWWFTDPNDFNLLTLGGLQQHVFDNEATRMDVFSKHYMERVFSKYPEVYGDTNNAAVAARLDMEVKWALTIVVTRVYAPRFEGDSCALVPLADLQNHDVSERTLDFTSGMMNVAGNPDDKQVPIVRTYRQIANNKILAGQELFARYDVDTQLKCDYQLLQNYGFVSGYQRAQCLRLEVAIPPLKPGDDALKAFRTSVFAQAGLQKNFNQTLTLHWDLHKGDSTFPPDLLSILRISRLQFGEASVYTEAINKNMPVSLQNELGVLRSLRNALQTQSTAFHRDFKAAVEGGMVPNTEAMWTTNQRNILRMHEGSLSAIKHYLGVTEQMWLRLLNSDYQEELAAPIARPATS